MARETKRHRKRITRLEPTRYYRDWRANRLAQHTQSYMNKGNTLKNALQALRDEYAHNWVSNERLFQKGLKERKQHINGQAGLILRINHIDKLLADEARLKEFNEKHRFRLPKGFVGKDVATGFKVKTSRLIKLAREAKDWPEIRKWQKERLHRHVKKRMKKGLGPRKALTAVGEAYLRGLEEAIKEGYHEHTLAIWQAKVDHINYLLENKAAFKKFKKEHGL